MTFIVRAVALAVGSIALLGGCANQPSQSPSPFASVQSDVASRVRQRVQWNRYGTDDRAVAAAVRSMLATELSADQAVQIALLNNRDLQATYEDLGIAQADLVQAGLLKNPVFNAAFEFADGGGTKLQFSVVEDFIDVLKLPLRKTVAESGLNAAKLRVTAAVVGLAAEVRDAYYAQQAAGQMLALRRSVVAASEASYEFAQRLHDAGNTPDLDLFNEQSMYEQSKLDLAASETAVLDGRERLNVLMGLWGSNTTWKIGGRLPNVPADEPIAADIERQAIERSLDLAVARNGVESAAQTLGIKRMYGLLPDVGAGVSSEKEADGLWETGPSVSVPIPLFDFGQGATAAARAELERNRQRYYAVAVQVRSAARAARNRLLAAHARAQYIQRVIVPLRHRIVQQTQLQYNAMLVGPFQLLQSKQSEIEAGAQLVEADRDYWLARSQLDELLSGKSPASNQAGGRS